MKLNIKNKQLVRADILETIEGKLQKFDRYFGADAPMQLKFKEEKDTYCVELTCHVERHIYRVESKAVDFLTAAEQAVSTLERQIRKQKSKLEKKIREYAYLKEALKSNPIYYNEESKEGEQKEATSTEGKLEAKPELVRRKHFLIDSRTPEDAILQMELLGHNFYLFLNEETGRVACIYRRGDGLYGLLEPNYD